MNKALVLMNMGGARNKAELELFLRNMFNDENILTINNKFMRNMIASFITLSRINSAWENYEAIGGKSPINDISDQLQKKLQDKLPETFVTQAMRYTPPLTQKAIRQIQEQKIKEIVLLPLYPQYSTTTTKSSLDEFLNNCPEKFNCTIVDPFYKNQTFNQCIINEIKSKHKKDTHLIFSAHGLPQKIVDNGDPYAQQVQEHVRILSSMLEQQSIDFDSVHLAYQSKVGPMKWLDPSLDSKLENFKDKNVLIYPISFIIDNSETDFELDIEYREIAQELGIKEYNVCKCVNDSDAFVDTIMELIS
ncbi:MAG: ferrochelatase [Campylobacterota bacterium]|nr:ferrochelatase [Campylobacterota bacterium]